MIRNNITGIKKYTLMQILGTKNFSRDNIYSDLNDVNGYKPDETLDNCLKIINKRGNYNRYLFNFVNSLIIRDNLDINIKKIKKWVEKDFFIFSKYTHRDLWNYRLRLYKDGALKIKQRPEREEKHYDWPGWEHDASINDYLNNLPSTTASKTNFVLKKHNIYEIYSLIYSLQGNNLEEIFKYSSIIWQYGSLLNDLYNIKDDGVGKGEVLVAFLFGCKIMGVGDSFDVCINGEFIEIKAPNGLSFRFGTKASIGLYEFFKNILVTRERLKDLVNQLGEDNFRKLVDPNFFELSKQLLTKGNRNERAISSAIDCAEISSFTLSLIELWFFMAHTEIEHLIDHTHDICQDIFTKKFYIKDNKSLINVLSSLKYVMDPLKFKQDMEKEIKECFKGLNKLLIWNENNKEINIYYNANDIVIDSISQNGIKVIEKKYKKIDTTIEDTYEIWKENKNLDFYELYSNLDYRSKIKTKCLSVI